MLHFFYKGQLKHRESLQASEAKGGAMLNLESGDRIERFYEDSPEATIRATVNRLLSDGDEAVGTV